LITQTQQLKNFLSNRAQFDKSWFNAIFKQFPNCVTQLSAVSAFSYWRVPTL